MESRHYQKVAGAFSVYSYCQLPTRACLSRRLEAGTSDDFVQFLGGLGHLVRLSCNRVEIPGRRSTRAIQIIDTDHVFERLDGAERSFCLDPHPIGLVCGPVGCVVRRTQSPLHRATRR